MCRPRRGRVLARLYEKGTEFDFVPVEMRRGEHKRRSQSFLSPSTRVTMTSISRSPRKARAELRWSGNSTEILRGRIETDVFHVFPICEALPIIHLSYGLSWIHQVESSLLISGLVDGRGRRTWPIFKGKIPCGSGSVQVMCWWCPLLWVLIMQCPSSGIFSSRVLNLSILNRPNLSIVARVERSTI